MISYEMAKELKEAGLKWEPEIGDMFYWPKGDTDGQDVIIVYLKVPVSIIDFNSLLIPESEGD